MRNFINKQIGRGLAMFKAATPQVQLAVMIAGALLLILLVWIGFSGIQGAYHRFDSWRYNRSVAPLKKEISEESNSSVQSERNANSIQPQIDSRKKELADTDRLLTGQRRRTEETRRSLNAARNEKPVNDGNASLAERERRLCARASELYADIKCAEDR